MNTTHNTNEADEAAGDSETISTAMQLITLAAAVTTPQQVGSAQFMVTPPGYAVHEVTKDVEKANLGPNRKSGTILLKSLDSLIAYCGDQAASATAYIYADPDTNSITAVFNDQRASAGWRDHRAVFKAERTPEFHRWMDNNGPQRAKAQGDFAEFIEDNLADIQDPYAQQLLTVATTIQATTGIEFKSAKRLQDGQTQLTYSETIDARAGSDGGMVIPKEFTLGLRLFKQGEGYRLKARLKYRLAGGGVKFWYELDRPERAIEDAFAGYVETLREKSGYQVLIGSAA